MNIEQIDVDLLSSTSKSYTVRASVSSGAFRAQAISKGKSLVEAEEEAIKRAELRLKEHVGKEINTRLGEVEATSQALFETPYSAIHAAETAKDAIKRAELTTENPVEQEEKTKTSAVSPPEQCQDSELKGEKKEAKQEPPQTTPEQQPGEQEPNSAPQSSPDPEPQPREEKSNEEEEPSLLADTRERLLAKEQLQKIGLSLTKAEFAAAFQPNNWRTTPTAILEKWAQQFEGGIPEPELHQVEKLREELQRTRKLDSLKKSWSKIIALHWSGFAPPSRLELWREKESSKRYLLAKDSTDASGKSKCPGCGDSVRAAETPDGTPVLLDSGYEFVFEAAPTPDSKPQRRWLIDRGKAVARDCWPTKPGARGSTQAYRAHVCGKQE